MSTVLLLYTQIMDIYNFQYNISLLYLHLYLFIEYFTECVVQFRKRVQSPIFPLIAKISDKLL